MFSIDLKDAFWHVPLHPSVRHFFAFEIDGEVYQACALPMGWTNSPYVLAKVMAVFMRHLRSGGARPPLRSGAPAQAAVRRARRNSCYVDDLIFFCQGSRADALDYRAEVAAALEAAGFHRSPNKGTWEPTKVITHLGMQLDSRDLTVACTKARVSKLRAAAKDILCRAAKHRRWVPARVLAQFLGLAVASTIAITAAPLYCRASFDALRGLTSWHRDVRMPSQALTDMRWWRDLSPGHATTAPLQPPPTTAALYVDASPYGWGGVLEPDSPSAAPVRGFFNAQERSLHIGIKEALAVEYVIDALGPQLRHRRIALYEDNAGVEHSLRALASRTPQMMRYIRRIWRMCVKYDVRLDVRRVRSEDNPADFWSRVRDPSDWKLNPQHFHAAVRRFGDVTVDLFASETNRQITRFVSKYHASSAVATDAFSLDWGAERAWINPPWGLLPRVLTKIRADAADALVVAPMWTSAAWWPDFLELAVDYTVIAPARDVFFPGHLASVEPMGSPRWHVVVGWLSGGHTSSARSTPLA